MGGTIREHAVIISSQLLVTAPLRTLPAITAAPVRNRAL